MQKIEICLKKYLKTSFIIYDITKAKGDYLMPTGSGDINELQRLRNEATKRLDIAMVLVVLMLIGYVAIHYKQSEYTNLNIFFLGFSVMLIFAILSLYFGGQFSLNFNLLSILLISLALGNYSRINSNSFMILSFMHALTFSFLLILLVSQIPFAKYKDCYADGYTRIERKSILKSIIISIVIFIIDIFPMINIFSMAFFPETGDVWWILPNYSITLGFNHAFIIPILVILFSLVIFVFLPFRTLHNLTPEERLLILLMVISMVEGSIVYEIYLILSGHEVSSWFLPYISFGMLGITFSVAPIILLFSINILYRYKNGIITSLKLLRDKPEQFIFSFLFTFLLSAFIGLGLIVIFNITPTEINLINSSDLPKGLYYLSQAFVRGFWEGEVKPPLEYGIPLLYFTGPAAVYMWPTLKIRKSYYRRIKLYELILFAIGSLLLIALFIAMLKLSLPTTSYWVGIFISVGITVLSFYRALWEQDRVMSNLKQLSPRAKEVEYHSRRTLLHVLQATITLFVPALTIIGISEKFDFNLIFYRMYTNTISLNISIFGHQMYLTVESILFIIASLFSVLIMPMVGYIVPEKDLLESSNLKSGTYLRVSKLKLSVMILMFIISAIGFMITTNFYYQFLFGTIMSYIIVCIANLMLIYKNPASEEEDKE